MYESARACKRGCVCVCVCERECVLACVRVFAYLCCGCCVTGTTYYSLLFQLVKLIQPVSFLSFRKRNDIEKDNCKINFVPAS